MLRLDREHFILELLQRQGAVKTQDVAISLQVSDMTIRRDLIELEHKGVVRRVHGGAVLASDRDPGYWLRNKSNLAAKRAIGAVAAALVRPRSAIYLDSGTTAMEVARGIVRRSLNEGLVVRVVTPAVNVAAELVGARGVTVYQVGGTIDSGTFGVAGRDAVAQLEGLSFDMCFLGATGVDLVAGWTNSNPLGVEVKQAALSASRYRCVVADSEKYPKVCFASIAALDAVDFWITDSALADEDFATLTNMGLEVMTAPL